MAKISQLKRLLKESLSGAGELPAWIDQFIYIFNQAMDPIVTALTSKLTLNDNFSGRFDTFEFVQGVELEINPNVRGQVTAVWPCGAKVGYLVSCFGYRMKQNGNVGVTLGFSTVSAGVVSAVAAGTKVTATVFIQVG